MNYHCPTCQAYNSDQNYRAIVPNEDGTIIWVCDPRIKQQAIRAFDEIGKLLEKVGSKYQFVEGINPQDAQINITLTQIDGANGVLGQAYVGTPLVEMDIDDIGFANTSWVIAHEVFHTHGIFHYSGQLSDIMAAFYSAPRQDWTHENFGDYTTAEMMVLYGSQQENKGCVFLKSAKQRYIDLKHL